MQEEAGPYLTAGREGTGEHTDANVTGENLLGRSSDSADRKKRK